MTHKTIDVSENDVTVRELLRRYGPRARLTVTDGEQVVGRFVLAPKPPKSQPRKRMLGLHEGNILYMADDFDDPLPDEFWLGGDP